MAQPDYRPEFSGTNRHSEQAYGERDLTSGGSAQGLLIPDFAQSVQGASAAASGPAYPTSDKIIRLLEGVRGRGRSNHSSHLNMHSERPFAGGPERPSVDGGTPMKTATIAVAAAGMLALAAVAAPRAADAGCRGCVAAGVLGGLAAGAIIGGAIANSATPAGLCGGPGLCRAGAGRLRRLLGAAAAGRPFRQLHRLLAAGMVLPVRRHRPAALRFVQFDGAAICPIRLIATMLTHHVTGNRQRHAHRRQHERANAFGG